MQRFVEGEDRQQIVLLPPCLDDYVTENNPVRVIEAFVDELDLATLGFEGVVPEATGRPSYHPSTLLKITKCTEGARKVCRTAGTRRAAEAVERPLPGVELLCWIATLVDFGEEPSQGEEPCPNEQLGLSTT